jgi:hypothetical protein
MKAKPLLGLAVLATAGLSVLVAGCVADEEVEQAPTPTPGHRLGVSTSEPCLVGVTPIPASQQLPVTLSDIQQGLDGAYFVPDRGDCCPFHEAMREDFGDGEWVLLGNSSCDLYCRYSPSTGEVAGVPVITPDDLPTTTPSGFDGPTPSPVPPGHFSIRPTPAIRPQPENARLAADGKYAIADGGDGCAWQEAARETIDDELWVVLESPQCTGQFWFAPAMGDTRLDLHPTPRPTPTVVPPSPAVPRLDKPDPSEIKQGPDGKYYVPDRGDGCPWAEWQRSAQADGRTKVVLTTVCEDGIALWYFPETGEITFVVS